MKAFKAPPSHFVAGLQALLVTFLWSTSWVLIKIGLGDIPAITFAGLRYVLAFLILLPFFLRSGQHKALRKFPAAGWARLLLLGLLYYTLTQGAQYVGLDYLPAVTVSLLLNFSPVLVALLGAALLAERPSLPQWFGVLLSVAGTLIYFYPVAIRGGELIGFAAVIVGLLANAGSSVLGREINRSGAFSPLTVTVASMGVGAFLLLGSGILLEGLPRLAPQSWLIIAWLALVNTAFAFTLWNHTLRTLSAVESSVINNTMLIQIAILAWLFLGERLSPVEIAGLVVAGLGSLVVQVRRSRRKTVAAT